MYILLKRRTVAMLLTGVLVLCASLLIGIGLSRGDSAVMTSAEVNWGLSFNTSTGIPTGSATQEELQGYNALYVGNTGQKILYLTFDAGYENGYTAKILDTLKKHGVPATFFLVGNYLKTEPELVRRMVAEGHTVGNHTMNHPDMAAIADREAFTKELTELEELYESVTGEKMKKLYRPPQGKYSPENLKMAQELGYRTVFWSLAYADWDNNAQPTKQEAFDKLLPRVHNGAIVLLHSTSATNCEILDELLTKWEEMGYTFGKLPLPD